MNSVLQKIFSSVIRTGNLTVTTASGRKFTLGDGSGKPIAVRFTSIAAELGVLFNPELKFGEAYMNGTFVIDEGSIADVLALALAQEAAGKVPRWARPQSLIRQLNQRLRQLVGGSRRKAESWAASILSRSIRVSSMTTCSSAAPISKRLINRSKTPNLPKSVTLRRSS